MGCRTTNPMYCGPRAFDAIQRCIRSGSRASISARPYSAATPFGEMASSVLPMNRRNSDRAIRDSMPQR